MNRRELIEKLQSFNHEKVQIMVLVDEDDLLTLEVDGLPTLIYYDIEDVRVDKYEDLIITTEDPE